MNPFIGKTAAWYWDRPMGIAEVKYIIDKQADGFVF